MDIFCVSQRLFFLSSLFFHLALAQQQQDPSTLNGGSIMAMAGKNCLAIAVDKRFGSGPQMVNVSPRTVLIPHSSLVVAFTGLEGDVQSLSQELSSHVSAKMGRHTGFGFVDTNVVSSSNSRGRAISPKSMSTLLSHVLYGRRRSPYYVEPIVAGLEKVVVNHQNNGMNRENENCSAEGTKSPLIEYIPYLCAQDLIGAQSFSRSFACSGAASNSLYGTAEALWRPNLEPEELLRVCSRAFISALERDCLSGYGAILYLIVGGEGIIEYDLACRND